MLDQHRRELGCSDSQRLPQRIALALLLLLARLVRFFSLPLHRLDESLTDPLLGQFRHAAIVLPQLEVILETKSVLLVLSSLGDIPQQAQDSALGICKNDIAASVKLEEEPILAVGEGNFNDTVGAYLADGGNSPGAKELAQAGDERRGRRGGGAGKGSEVGAETGVDDELLAMLWFGEFEEEDAR
jgi:hypothetical protein